jgi:hypothetical protein
MKTLRCIEWNESAKVIACDVDRLGRLASLVQVQAGEVRAEIDGATYVLPSDWAADVCRINWLTHSEALVWPVEYKECHRTGIGKIGPNGAAALDLPFPLEIFSDLDLVALTFSEERITDGRSDIFAIYSTHHLRPIAQFSHDSLNHFADPKPLLLELEHGVLDGVHGRFWFTAFSNDYLWCFSLEEPRIVICELGCAKTDIVAISCQGVRASIILRQADGVRVRTYMRRANGLVFESQTDNLVVDTRWREVCEKLDGQSSQLRGRSENRILLMSASSVLLAEL